MKMIFPERGRKLVTYGNRAYNAQYENAIPREGTAERPRLINQELIDYSIGCATCLVVLPYDLFTPC